MPESSFQIKRAEFEPAYINLHRDGELWRRAQEAVRSLDNCEACPRNCNIDRLQDKKQVCKTGRYAIVSNAFSHFGEENCLRGHLGSGTIFFSMCNLRCVFCQNHEISHTPQGQETRPLQLAQMMLELQARGCHNINFVTPEHVVPQILEALPHAVEMGLNLPLIYNTGAYDSMESLEMMDGVIDIYMPDLKFFDPALSKKYLKAENYPEAGKRSIREMNRQVGELKLDENGLALRGVLLRHLVMPGFGEETAQIMRFIAEEVSQDTYVNIMNQYRPSGKVGRNQYPEINRKISLEEYSEAFRLAKAAGLSRFDKRPNLLDNSIH